MAAPSAFVQHWIVPASKRAPQVAHLRATANPAVEVPLCGERRRAWLPVSDVADPGSTRRCRRCLTRWRGLQAEAVEGQVVPHRFRDQHQAYLDALARRDLSEHTRRAYAANAAAFLRWAVTHDLPPRTWGLTSTAASYHHDLTAEEGLGAATLNARLLAQTDLARVLKVSRREPSVRQTRPIVTGQILSPAELDDICEQAAGHSSNAHILIQVLAATGLKPSEIGDLTTESMTRIDDSTVTLTVHGRQVAIAIDGTVLDLAPPRPLLTTGDHRVMSQRRIRQILTEVGHAVDRTDLAASTFRSTWIAQQMCAGTQDWKIGKLLGVAHLRTQPITAGLRARETADRGAIADLAPRTRTLTKTLGTAMINQAKEAQHARLASQEELDDTALELNLRVLRHIRHVDQLDLSTFITNHDDELAAIYTRYAAASPVWLIRQPAALYVWAALDAENVIVDLPQLNDMRSVWESPHR